jgi:hypothetical protein
MIPEREPFRAIILNHLTTMGRWHQSELRLDYLGPRFAVPFIRRSKQWQRFIVETTDEQSAQALFTNER